MQYLLTHEEFKAITEQNQRRAKELEATLQDLCTKVADHMPINWGWGTTPDPKPWGCILSQKGEWYCDQCPVRDVCPNQFKHFSK